MVILNALATLAITIAWTAIVGWATTKSEID